MSRPRFFGLILLCYFGINILFTSLYMLTRMEHLTGIDGTSTGEKFMEAFFFSAQTITTLGYGRVAPRGVLDNSIGAVESLLGLLSFVLATGLLYGRFSKPSARVKYSTHAVIAPYQDGNAIMFRLTNPHSNQLLEVEIEVTLSIKGQHSVNRNFHRLELERSKVIFFPYMWTIVHPLTTSSPLFGLTEKHFHDNEAEFIVTLKAFDESFSQTIHSRYSYKSFEIKWGEKYVYVMNLDDETLVVDVGRIDETEKITLNSVT